MVFPTFFNLSLNFSIRSSWSEPQSKFLFLFLLTVRVGSSLVLLEEGVCYDQCVFWQNSISLCPASFRTPRPNLPVSPGVSWLPTFAFQSPIMKRASFLVLILEVIVGLHSTIQIQLLQHYCLGHRLGLPWYWMVCLGNEQRQFYHFWDCIQVLHFGLFCWPWWLLHFF